MSDGDLRKAFRQHLPGFDWLSVETGSTSSGVPDMNYAAPGNIEGWIEMKKVQHWRAVIRPMQIGWCERRLRFNDKVFVAIRRSETELWMFHASQMRYLHAGRVNGPPNLGCWSGGPGKWDWDAVRRILLGHSSSESSSTSSISTPSKSR
jgi:hypothetical protein